MKHTNQNGVRTTVKVERFNVELPGYMVNLLDILLTADRGVHNAYLAVLHEAGWSYRSLGKAIGVRAETVRQRILKVRPEDVQCVLALPNKFVVPGLPIKNVRETFHVPTKPSAEAVARLLELKPLAQAVRSSSPKFRAEAEEYTALMYKVLTEEGVTVYQLAKALGVTRVGITTRLIRYGYTEKVYTKSNDKIYRQINPENRAQLSKP